MINRNHTISIKAILQENYPYLFQKYPKIFVSFAVLFLERILRIKRINTFLTKHAEIKGISFIDELFEEIDFSYLISNKDRQKIPSEGRLICVSNHPLGALDGLALLKAVSEIRSDVRIVANDLLLHIDNLRDMFLPFTLDSRSIQRDNLIEISKALNNDEAVIFFPSGTVSRLNGLTIKDGYWHKGAIYFAQKHQVPILPVFVKAKNSLLFYIISIFSSRLSMLMLPRELFNKKNRTITIKIGEPIPAKSFSSNMIGSKVEIKLLKKHVYLIGRNQPGIFLTEKNIISPVDKKTLKKELSFATLLGYTRDEKKIYMTTFDKSPNVIKEICRLREHTFRKVGEGSGKKIDFDRYDEYYKHILIWDDLELDVVGAYRIGNCSEILSKHNAHGLYTYSLFEYTNNFIKDILPNSIELGRSFIQKKYWNTYALDYLWQGIGMFLTRNPDIKFMFGAVSISNSYSEEVKNLLVYFFSKWFRGYTHLASSRNRFIIGYKKREELSKIFDSSDYKQDFKKLKFILKQYGYSIPTLYKQYSELCENGGVEFIDFGIDESFEKCIDGLILVKINLIKAEKRERYMSNSTIYEKKVVNI
jgi:putative hemolysin